MAIVNLNVFVADDKAEQLANLLCRSVRIGGLGKELCEAGFNIGSNYGTTIKLTHPEAEQPIRFGLCPPSEKLAEFKAEVEKLSTPVPQELQHLMPDGYEMLRSMK